MTVRAFVLAQTEVGKASEVVAAFRRLPQVLSADNVIGPYDVIACVETQTVRELGPLLMSTIQRIPGVDRTETCTVVDS